MGESRTYRSARRAQQAADTRREILRAARGLFAERGYAGTSLADVAAEAGVSVPTLYASVGSKAKIALALVEFTNVEVGMAELARALAEVTTGPALIAAEVHLNRVLNELGGDVIRALVSAAASEPEVVPSVEEGRDYHRRGQRAVAARLARMGALRPGVDVSEAAAVLTAMTLPEMFAQLTLTEGWSFDRVEEWLTDGLTRLLLTAGERA